MQGWSKQRNKIIKRGMVRETATCLILFGHANSFAGFEEIAERSPTVAAKLGEPISRIFTVLNATQLVFINKRTFVLSLLQLNGGPQRQRSA